MGQNSWLRESQEFMKINLTIVLSVLCFLGIHAQKLNVESFVVKANDITARTQPRQDINGNDCALVKVRLAAENASFRGNVVGDVAYDKSEYYVYMPHGSKRLTIKLDGYLPLDVNFEEFGINTLEGKTVYVMTIAGVSGTQQLEAPKTKTGWIILDSEPSGASVYINNEFVGNTPLSNYKQAYGTYQYRLESPNYHPATGTIELNAGRFEHKIALKPAFGSISVKSNVAGAKILLDGKPTGKNSPATLAEIPSGSHTITLQLDKYAPQQQNVVVEDGQTADISMSLDARFAMITINSLDGAEIYSNGKLMGKGRISEDMMEGYYDIEARLDHYKSVTKQIQVVAGQSQDITLNPIPKYGTLDITSIPHDAEVSIDGKYYGKTPLTIDQLLEGEHQVVISKSQYEQNTRIINISENVNASIDLTLETASNERTFIVGGVKFKMIAVEGGTFTMGATSEQGNEAFDNEKPTHKVTLNSYSIGETEVTHALWHAVMGNTSFYTAIANMPANEVSWEDCNEFINKLNVITGENFRLPSEAEWEYAARGGNKSRGYKYAGSNTIDDVAWYINNWDNRLHDVATKQANELGLYDMSGNVWELCSEWFSNYSSSAYVNSTDPNGGSFRVMRGGSFCDDSRSCRVSQRGKDGPEGAYNVGLRLVL